MMTTPLPKGKLDAMTTLMAVSVADDGGVVNGPEGEILDWDAIDWRAIEENVRRLRHRIFTASRAGDLKKVRNLQKLMLRSRANTLVSVRRGDAGQRWSKDPWDRWPGGAVPRGRG